MYNILYPRLTKADPCLKSVNILCLVIKAEDLRYKPYLIHFLSRTSWIQPQNKTPRHLHSMQGSRIFTKEGRGSAQRIILFPGINSDFKLILHVPDYNFLVLRILIFYVLLVFLSSKRVWVHSTLYMHILNFRVFDTFSWPVHIM